MTRYRFIGVWVFDGKDRFVNMECTRWEIKDGILLLWDGDLFVGQAEMSRLCMAFFTEVGA